MAIIYSYPIAVPTKEDKLVITQAFNPEEDDPDNFNPTKSATISSIVDLVNTGLVPGAGTVTSVGITMPSAFTVGNGSPVTSAGVINITGSGASTQYIDGTGSLQLSPNQLLNTTSNVTFSTIYATPIIYAANQNAYALKIGASDASNYDMGLKAKSTSTGVNYMSFTTTGTEDVLVLRSGKVGIGTDSPSEKLEVQGSIFVKPITYEANQNAYALKIGASNANEYVMGLKAKSTSTGVNYMSFTTTNVEDVLVLQSGRVGIGMINPAYKLQLSADEAAKPSSSTWTIVSDERVKENIKPYEKGLNEILQVNTKTFDYNGKAGFDKIKDNVGVIAQDMIKIFPETIKTYDAKLNETDKEETELYNFNGHALTFALINAIQELKAEIEELKKTNK